MTSPAHIPTTQQSTPATDRWSVSPLRWLSLLAWGASLALLLSSCSVRHRQHATEAREQTTTDTRATSRLELDRIAIATDSLAIEWTDYYESGAIRQVGRATRLSRATDTTRMISTDTTTSSVEHSAQSVQTSTDHREPLPARALAPPWWAWVLSLAVLALVVVSKIRQKM